MSLLVVYMLISNLAPVSVTTETMICYILIYITSYATACDGIRAQASFMSPNIEPSSFPFQTCTQGFYNSIIESLLHILWVSVLVLHIICT